MRAITKWPAILCISPQRSCIAILFLTVVAYQKSALLCIPFSEYRSNVSSIAAVFVKLVVLNTMFFYEIVLHLILINKCKKVQVFELLKLRCFIFTDSPQKRIFGYKNQTNCPGQDVKLYPSGVRHDNRKFLFEHQVFVPKYYERFFNKRYIYLAFLTI